MESQAEIGGWRAGTKAGFRKKHHLEDLAVPVDYLLDGENTCSMPLSICLVDLEMAFDTVNRAWLLEVLQEYGLSSDMLEVIHSLNVNTRGYVAGANKFFCSTMGVR